MTSEFLYHGTACPQKILSDGVLEKAKLGHLCVSLSRSEDVARYFATLDREELTEDVRGIFVFRRADLIAAGFELIPYHDELWGDHARDEQEEQIWEDVPLDTGLLHQMIYTTDLDFSPPPLMKDQMATASPSSPAP